MNKIIVSGYLGRDPEVNGNASHYIMPIRSTEV